MDKKKIIVAMSGGVDSSVAAALLAREGHEVIGVTMRLLPRGGEGFGCCGSPDDVLIAKRSAEKAGVPHYVLDYSPDFKEKVIDYFVNSYIVGETPNPCLACNRYIKFDKLKGFADSVNATHLATGHYARIEKGSDGLHHLYAAIDPSKDQSYVLYNFNQTGLASTIFPVGHAPKAKIREMARDFGLPNADKKDSQEICFVPRKDYRSFVDIKIRESGAEWPNTVKPGVVQDTSGKTVGHHNGVAYYTIGQRSGLSVASQEKLYVSKIDPATNTLVVGPDQQNLTAGLIASDVNWIAGTPPSESFDAMIKIRYKHEPTPARITVNGPTFEARFTTPQRAVTPGQAAVIYRFDPAMDALEVIGGGKITKPL